MSYNTAIYLSKGWNLVSFYLDDINSGVFFNNENIIEIKSINKSFNQKIPKHLNTLKNIERGLGYWMKTRSEILIQFSGNVNKDDYEIDIKKGWNLIGYPFNLGCNMSQLKVNVIEIKSINQSFNSKLPKNLNTLKKFQPSEGYWCKAEENFILKLEYPFEYPQKDENNQISGMIVNDSIDFQNLENNFKKVTYSVNNTEETNIELPWNLDRYKFEYKTLQKISDCLINLKFAIYYGNWNGKQNSVAAYFYDKFTVLDDHKGDINFKISEFKEDQEIFEIYFGGNEGDKITFNIKRGIIVVGLDNAVSYINNLEFKNMDSSKKKIVNPNVDSVFFTDYILENIHIFDLKMSKNDKIVDIVNSRHSFDFTTNIFKLLIFSENNYYSLEITALDNIDKTLDIKFVLEDGKTQSVTKQIIYNNVFELIIEKDVFNISFKWNGTENYFKNYSLSKFNKDTEYLYWYNLSKININTIKFNETIFEKPKVLEKTKDYLILESDNAIYDFKFIILKDYSKIGCINFTTKFKNKTNLYYSNKNTISIVWPIYNKSNFNIGKNIVNFDWEGEYDKLGYKIVNEQIEKQRTFALNLNASRIITVKNLSVKVHYMVGYSKDTINLNIWDSYESYLNIFEKLLAYLLDYIEEYGLKLPEKDSFIKRNGGDANYDIYIMSIANDSVKGFTAGEAYIPFTPNPFDVYTYMVLSNDLNYDWLKTVLFHEFFHSIQGSYDWFDSRWISEGLATVFESSISNNIISPRYFIPHIFEKQNLALSYTGNMRIGSDSVIVTTPLSTYGGKRGDITLEIRGIILNNNELVNISTLNLNSFSIENINGISIRIIDKKIYTYRGVDILKLRVVSDKSNQDLRFKLFIGGKLVTNIATAYSTRQYGTFTFFQYLIDRYGSKNIFGMMLNNTISYNNYEVIENTVKAINPNSSFINEVINFWTAVEVLTDKEIVDEKYRLSKSSIWENMYSKKYYGKLSVGNFKDTLKIYDLEPTGCINLEIETNGFNSARVSFDPSTDIFNLNLRLVIQYNTGDYNIIEIRKENMFDLQFNKTIYRVSLLIIADKNYAPNDEIEINILSSSAIPRKISDIEVDHVKFSLKVQPK